MEAAECMFLKWIVTLTSLKDHYQKRALKHVLHKILQITANMGGVSLVT